MSAELVRARLDEGKLAPTIAMLEAAVADGASLEEMTGATDHEARRKLIEAVATKDRPELTIACLAAPAVRGGSRREVWYAPDVGLVRVRYPWDPKDLPERLRAAPTEDPIEGEVTR